MIPSSIAAKFARVVKQFALFHQSDEGTHRPYIVLYHACKVSTVRSTSLKVMAIDPWMEKMPITSATNLICVVNIILPDLSMEPRD